MAMIPNNTCRYQRMIIVCSVGLVLASIFVQQSCADEQKPNVLIIMDSVVTIAEVSVEGTVRFSQAAEHNKAAEK